MKKVFLICSLLAGLASFGYCADYGQEPTNTAGSVTTIAISTFSAVEAGTVRKLYNSGSQTIWFTRGANTTVTTLGEPIISKQTYTWDEYYGVIYLMSTTSTNAYRLLTYKKFQY